MNWFIGCSGFHYKHWKGSFYPQELAQKKWFDYYCQHYTTLELNSTFYKFPRFNYLKNWYNISPPQFKFSIKAPRAITHFKKFLNSASMLYDFYHTTREGLEEKAACILFQFPEKFVFSVEHLERITENLDYSFSNVLEFRHSSWWNDYVYQHLTKQQVSFCGMSHPDLPAQIISTNRTLYYRLHGAEQLYASSYSSSFLQEMIAEIEANKQIRDAYIYFNNDIFTNAVFNSLEMKRLLGLNT